MRFYITASIYKLDLEAAHKFYSVGNVTFLRRRGGHNVICITILAFHISVSDQQPAQTLQRTRRNNQIYGVLFRFKYPSKSIWFCETHGDHSIIDFPNSSFFRQAEFFFSSSPEACSRAKFKYTVELPLAQRLPQRHSRKMVVTRKYGCKMSSVYFGGGGGG